VTDVQKPKAQSAKRATFLFKAWGRFKKNPLVLLGLAILIVIFIMAVAAPIIAPYNPNKINYGHIYDPPNSQFLLGTDGVGRDILSRIIYGARSSLLVGIVSVSISITIGISIGSISGFFGGPVDTILMRFTDMIMTIPSLFFNIILVSIFRMKGLGIVMAVIGLLGWAGMARVVRSEVLSLKQRAYVEASRSMGEKEIVTLFKEVLPNTITPITIMATMRMGRSILIESSLSWLGLGDPSVITWGRMLASGQSVLNVAWWIATYPGLFIFLTVLSFNLLGDGLRDALDVRI
jgi:peptide/nickel transport system permease protein